MSLKCIHTTVTYITGGKAEHWVCSALIKAD